MLEKDFTTGKTFDKVVGTLEKQCVELKSLRLFLCLSSYSHKENLITDLYSELIVVSKCCITRKHSQVSHVAFESEV